MFEHIYISKSGKELKDIAKARINRDEFQGKLPMDLKNKLTIMSKHLTDNGRYTLSLEEAEFLGI